VGGGTPPTQVNVNIEVEPEDLAEASLARRTRDVLFAAVALRDGLVLVPELERALREQLREHPEEPALEDVLRDRGILSHRELDLVGQALDAAKSEKLAIPGYVVEDVLGHGATSIVLRARQELIDRPVAIKLFREEHAAATDVNTLVEEARTIARIRHPNVVGLFDVGRLHRRIYYVMELVDGRTLLDLIREKARGEEKGLDEREALGIARGICCALEAIHAAGLVHRDVKPLNVLIARGGIVKLTDLGLAREVGRKDETPDAVYGSPYTISPEQVQGEPVDIRADLYGLGATLFQTLTGEPPFEGTNPLAVMMRHVTEPVPDPRTRKPGLGAGAAELVQRLMAKSRDERPSLPAHVIEAIDKLLC
jgi:serine/threonine-protein kinase